MNTLDLKYQSLLQDIMVNGTTKETRNGKVQSIFGHQIRHNMSEGFPLLTTKKMAIKTLMTELKWFLLGKTDLKWLLERNCNIWTGDAFKKYYEKSHEFKGSHWPDDIESFKKKILEDDEFSKKWGDLGPIYGHQWRDWGGYDYESLSYATHNTQEYKTYHKKGIDQLKELLHQLKTNPDSRRMMVNAWNVNDLGSMTLPPCHYGFQVYTRKLTYNERYDLWMKNNYETGFEKNDTIINFDDPYWVPTPERAVSLIWNQRSVDTFLGLPFNIASYGTLLHLIAEEVSMVPDILIGNLGDTHIYSEHNDAVKEQLMNEPYELPKIKFTNVNILNGEFDYELINYKSHKQINAPLIN